MNGAKVQKLMPDPRGVVLGVGEEGLLGACSGAIEARGYRVVREGVAELAIGFSLSSDEVRNFRGTATGRHLPLILVHPGVDWMEGGDVVIRWPVRPEFVAAQLEALHARTLVDRSVSTLTGLPGGRAAAAEMNARLEQDVTFYATYIDVNNFKAYNDAYGFDRGDRVLEALSVKILEAAARMDDCGTFCGHVGGDDFLVVNSRDPSQSMEWLAYEFDRMIRAFYSKADITRGGIVSFDREGRRRRFPLMSISVVTLRRGEGGPTLSELSQDLAAVKRRAKAEAASAESSVHICCEAGIHGDDSVSLLVRLIEDVKAETHHRRAAMEAAGELRLRETVESLRAVLRTSPDEMLRKSAAYSLGRIADRGCLDGLAAALGDSSAHVRMRAAEGLGQIGDSSALSPLLVATSDENPHVRSAAVSALGRLGVRAAISRLVECLEDRSMKVRLSSVVALGLLGATEAFVPIEKCLEAGSNRLNRSAAEAMGHLCDARCIPALGRALTRSDTETVWRAAYSLYLLLKNGPISAGDLSAAERLTEILTRKDGYIRRSAALALGAMAATGAAKFIIPLLFDKRDYVRSAAAWALGRIGERTAVGPLRAALKDGRSTVRSKAAWALGELGMDSAVEPLRQALKDRVESVRHVAAVAICGLLERTVASR